ncbi:MAG TPA: hypothetical protein VFL54_09965 [Gammaproteobacteria bacterium]|nr:hypothetical protein [Gammaproteobacteria bacterium]
MAAEDQVNRLLKDVAERRFWGDVQITFRDGKPTLVRLTETKRLDGGTADGKASIRSRR